MRQFMQEGGQPNMAAANPTIDQLLPAIKSALEQGASLPEIIMGLTQQEVPMEIIAQAMQSIGVPEEEFAMAMQQLQGGAPQDQMAQQAPPMPPQGGPEGAPMDPAMEQAMMEQMASQGMPMAQEGAETGGNYEDSMLYIGDMGEDAPTYEPRETVITDHDKTYHYKQVYDPSTGETKYYSKDTRYKRPQWKDAGKQGDQKYDAISADVFGQNLENYSEDDPRRADFNKKLKKWEAEEEAKKKDPPSKGKVQSDLEKINNIDWTKYKVKVIQYPYGDERNMPGHIEMALYDPETGKIVNDHEGLITHVNRWYGKAGNPDVKHKWDADGMSYEDQKKRKIRTAILDLQPEQIKDFVLKSQDYMGTDYGSIEKTAVGKRANAYAELFDTKIPWSNIPLGDAKDREAYDFARSNCADGVCMSLGIPEDVEKNLRVANITSPYKVFDYLIDNYNTQDVKNFRQPTEDEFVESMVDEYYPELYKKMPGAVQTLIGPTISDKNRKKLVNFAKGLDFQKILQTPGYLEGELGKFMLPTVGDNQAVKMLWEESVNEAVKKYTPFDLSKEGKENIIPWWEKNVFNPIGDWWQDTFTGGPTPTKEQINQGRKDWETQKMTSNVGWKGFEEGGSTGRYNDLVRAQYGYGKGLTTLTAGLPPESEEKPSSATEFMVDNMFGEGAYKSGKAALEDAQKWTEKHYQNFEPSKVLTDPVGAIDSVGKYWGLWQRGGGLDPQNIAKFSEFVDDYSRAQEGMDSVVGFALDDRLYDENNPAAVRSYMMESGAPDRSMTGYAKVPEGSADWKDYGSRNQDALRAEMEADPAWAAHPNSQPERPKPKPTVPKNVIDHMGYSRNIPGQSMYNTVNDLARFVRGYEDAKYDLEDSFGYNPPDVSNPAVVKQAMMQEPWRYGLTDYVDMDDQGNPIEGPMLSIPQGYSSFEEYANSPAMQKQIEERRRYGGSTKRRLKRAQLGYGGGYTLPINMVEDYQESKPGIIAADNMTPEQQAAYNNFLKLKQTYDAEVARVADVKQKIGDLARQHGDANAGWMDIASDWPRTGKWFEEPGNYACNSYSCRIMREAGVTVPEGVEPFKVSGNPYTYAPGDKIPIVTGNDTFNSIYEKLGFELMPKGTMPTKAGDLIRGHMYDPNASGSGAFHSVISAGYGDDERLYLYNNPGNVREGYRARGTDWDDPMRTGEGDFYTTDSGVMRYVGAVPYHEKQMMEAEAAYNALFEKQTGGTIPTLFEGSDEGFGSQGATADPVESQIQYYFSLPATMDGEPGPGGFGTIGEFKMAPKEQQIEWVTWASTQQNDQFTPGQMNPQNQQMMQLLEEVNSAKGGDKKYRTKSKQTESKKKGGSTDGAIELTTEQIAKIMAAGGSVKYL
jgi:hypothetical protein